MSLAEKIAAARANDERHARVMADDARQTEELMNFSPTDGMSTAEKLGAGFQSGLRNVGRNIGNMTGFISDESLVERDELDAPLGETGAGSIGQFAGEMAALAPVGVAGSAARGAMALPRALKVGSAVLPRAMGAGLPGAAAALTEGALAGAVLADSGERGSGAMQGAGTALALNKTLGSLGRKFTKGFDESDAAKGLGDVIEDLTGKRPSLPVAQSANSKAVQYPHKSVMSMFPLARGGSKKMEANATQDWGEAILVQTFGKKNRAVVAAAVKEADGDIVTAGQKLLKDLSKKGYKQNKDVLASALDDLKAGEILTPNKIDSASKRFTKGETRPFYDLVSKYAKVMESPIEESTVSGRRMYNKVMNKAVPATLGAAVSGGALPYLALTGGTRAATAAPVQNFMMGRSALNRGMEAVGKAASPYAAAIRNTYAGQ